MTTIASAPNFRPVEAPGLRRGVLFRSEAIVSPDPAEAAALSAHDIRFVCDLRSEVERRETPNHWWTSQGVALVECDILAHIPDDMTPWAALADDPGRGGATAAMTRLYQAFPDAAAPYLPRIVVSVVEAPGASLIHCTAGKDRTGFVCAVLLALVGVPRDAILVDYLASRGRRTIRARAATRTMLRERVERIDEDGLDALMGVEADYLHASLAAIDARGGVEAYAAAAGVDGAMTAALRDRLLA